MRPVRRSVLPKTIVLVETIALAALAWVWWLAPSTGPVTRAGAGARAAIHDDAPTGSGAAITAPGRSREPNARRSARPVGATGSPDVLLLGRLSTSDGSPLPEKLSLAARRDDSWRTATTLGGRYGIAGLRAGEWQLVLRADGFRQRTWSVVLDTRTEQVEDIVLQRAPTLQVFVAMADDTPFPDLGRSSLRNLWVVATTDPLTGDLPPTDTGHHGDVGIGRFEPAGGLGAPPRTDGRFGDLWLDEDPPANAALVLGHVVLAEAPIAAGQTELRFVVDPAALRATLATVTMRLIDGTTGAPITTGAIARLRGLLAMGAPGDDGRVTFEGVLPGIHELQVDAGKERERWIETFRVGRGAAVDLGELRLQPALQLRGRVLSTSGEPAAGARLLWTDLDLTSRPHRVAERRFAGADDEGRFALVGIGARRYLLVALLDGSVGTTVVDLRGGPPSDVEIRLRAGATVRVEAPSGTLDGYTVTLLDAEGVLVAAARITPREPRVTLIGPIGRYTLVVQDARDSVIHRERIDLTPGEPKTLSIAR